MLPQGLQPPGFVCWPRWAPDPPLMMRGCTRKPSLQWPGWAPDPCCRHACCCCARCRICSPLTAHCAPSSPRAAARPSSRPRLLRPVAVFGAPLALNPNHPVGGGKPGGVHSHLPRWRGGELGGQLSSAQPSRFFCALPVPARGTAVVSKKHSTGCTLHTWEAPRHRSSHMHIPPAA